MVKRFTNEMRRSRLTRRHLLSDPAEHVDDVVQSLVAVHSSDPATVFLSMWARINRFSVADLEEALYESKRLLRIYGMRRTLWVVDRETFPEVDRSSTNLIAGRDRRRFEKIITEAGVTDDAEQWVADVEASTLKALTERGEAFAKELTPEVPALSEKFDFHNKKGQLVGTVGMSTRTLVMLALESKIIRGRPGGTWVSSQYRWSTMERWLGGPIPSLDPDEAAAMLIERYLHQFGPATINDAQWWTGWTKTRTRKTLENIGAVEVQLDDGIGFVLPGDEGEEPASPVSVALLPSLDATTMGWKERSWYLGDHYPTLFDRNGNAGPTIWANGKVVGGWAQRKSGEIVYEILEDTGSETAADIEAKASDLQGWLGDITVTPRFRSPHDKTITA